MTERNRYWKKRERFKDAKKTNKLCNACNIALTKL